MKKLKEYLDRKGLRQDKFAQKIGMDAPTLSHIMNGRRKIPEKCWKKIVQETNGEITLEDLLEHSLNFQKNKTIS